MKNSNQPKNLVIAGTLTGLVLAVVVAFSGGGSGTVDASENVPQVNAPTGNGSVQVDAQYVQTLQAQNSQLTNAVNTLQAREQQFRGQIDLANQSIQELQGQANTATYSGQYEEEEHEEDDD